MSTVNNGPQIVRTGLILDLDAGYMRSYSPNVMPNPTNIFAWSGTGNNNCTLSGDTTITRQYGSIPLKMVMTGTDPYTATYGSSINNLAPAASGQTWTLSFYAKASETVTGNCFIFGANSGGGYIEAPSTSFTVTTSWQRFTFTTTLGNASTAFIQMRFGGSSGQVGKTIWWDGVQLERASSATAFNPYYIGDTIWRDVSGSNYNGTFTNGPTFSNTNSGTIVFPGNTDNRIQTSYGPTFTNFTISLWFKDNNSVQYGRLLDKSYTGGFWLGRNGSTANSWGGGILESSPPYGIYLTLTDGQWHFLTSIRSGTSHILYGDGITNTTNNVVSSTALDTTTLAIGGWSGGVGSQQFTGNISNVLFYNRALTATEVLQNYEATKTRFGL